MTTEHSPFEAEPDAELGQLLRDQLQGPNPDAFLVRLRTQFLAAARERESQWEVLARWARPSVVAAAVLAAFALGVTFFTHWVGSERQASSPRLPIAALDSPQPVQGLVWYTVLEER